MDSRLRQFRTPLAVVATVALVALSPGTVMADDTRPLEETVESVERKVNDDGAAPETRTPDAPEAGVAESMDSAWVAPSRQKPRAAEQDARQRADRAEAKLVDLKVGGQDVLGLGHSKAEVGGNGDSRAGSTLLAIGGQEVIGAHAASDGKGEGHAGDPLAPLCEGSEGQLCLRLLYADAWASQDGEKSSSRAENGVANVCLGGSSAERDQVCDGPIAAGVLESRAEAQRDSETGKRSGAAESHVADVCLGQDGGSCALGVELFKSFSSAKSGPGGSNAGGDAAPLQLELGGEKVVPIDETVEIGIPDCEEPVVCLRLNEDGVQLGSDGAAGDHTGLVAEVLDGTPLAVTGLVSHTAADASAAAADDAPIVAGEEASVGGPGHPGTGAATVDNLAGILPDTGGVWSGLLALALLALSAGAFLVAAARRPAVVAAS